MTNPLCALGLHRWSPWTVVAPVTHKTANEYGEALVSQFARACQRCGATRERIDYTRERA